MKSYIHSDSEILGGTPVIKGTRIPIDVVMTLLKQGNTINDLHKMYPWVELSKLTGVIDEISQIVSASFNAKKVL